MKCRCHSVIHTYPTPPPPHSHNISFNVWWGYEQVHRRLCVFTLFIHCMPPGPGRASSSRGARAKKSATPAKATTLSIAHTSHHIFIPLGQCVSPSLNVTVSVWCLVYASTARTFQCTFFIPLSLSPHFLASLTFSPSCQRCDCGSHRGALCHG